MNYSIIYNNKEIFFSVEFRNRKSTAIQIKPDLSVRVLAPAYTSGKAIVKIVSGKARWILKKQQEFASKPELQKTCDFRNGEIFKFLGGDLVLYVTDGKPSLIKENNTLQMTVPSSFSRDQRRKLLQKWFREQSETVFSDRMAICINKADCIGIKKIPEWKSRVLKRSWGSCSAKGKINLNLELVSTPVACIDYVILHELCHLREHNHGPGFYRLMDRVCPEWKHIRKELNSNYQTRLV